MKKIIKLVSALIMVLCVVFLICSCGPKNGLIKENGYTYYYIDGEMQTGWQEISGDWYYFGTNTDVPKEQVGAMYKNHVVGENGKYYGLGSDGKMVANEFIRIGDNQYYFGSNGEQVVNTQIEVGGKKYIIDDRGVARKAPYYSAPATMGGMYNFYLKDTFPLTLSYYSWTTKHGKWTIIEAPSFEVFGNTLVIGGIVEYSKTSEIRSANFDCRLSSVDENGITDSVIGYANSAEVRGGEKTKFVIEFKKKLPLIGRDIYVEFIGNK